MEDTTHISNDIFNISDDVIIVTGAGGGLGSELALMLAQAKARVILIDKILSSMDEIASKLNAMGLSYCKFSCDITDSAMVKSTIKQIYDKYGCIDAIVNCAGILGADDTLFNITEADWNQVMAVNLTGTWLMATEVARYMKNQTSGGRIVNISSSLGGRAQSQRVHYATSKAGIEHLTRNMAMELIDFSIRVNCLAPGWVATPMVASILDGAEGGCWKKSIPMHRAANPKELMGPLLLLVSNASSYMTGSCLRVDGGYSYCGIEKVQP